MPALCPHGQGEGVVSQMWAGLDRGRGVAKIPKFVRTSFMDDPTAKRSKVKLDSIILFFDVKKQPAVVFYKKYFLKISQNLQENTPVQMS